MIPIEKCKEILNNGERKYTDEEIIKIRNLLYQLGYLDYEIFKKKAINKKKIEGKNAQTNI